MAKSREQIIKELDRMEKDSLAVRHEIETAPYFEEWKAEQRARLDALDVAISNARKELARLDPGH